MTRLMPALLTAALLSTVAYATPASTAAMLRPTCHGQRATVVGNRDVAVLRGTDGPDVIVTHGANIVVARGGDDTICVTGRPRPGSLITIDAGRGDDLVDAGTQSTRTYILLRSGSDVARGGTGADAVFAGGSGTDRIATGPGADTATARADARVHLGKGDDRLNAFRPTTGAILDGGSGVNYLDVTPRPGLRWELDNRLQVARADGKPAFSWTYFTIFDLGGFAHSTGLRFSGSDSREHLLHLARLSGVPLWVALWGGHDHLTLRADMPGTFAGGLDRDTVTLVGAPGDRHDSAAVALGRQGSVAVTSPSATYAGFALKEFEVLHLSSFSHADVTGGSEDEAVSMSHGCGLHFSGSFGDDRIIAVDFDESCPVSAENRVVASGGPGDDQLLGASTDDDLRGDEGNDTAQRGEGTDYCDAETRVECELP